MFEKLIVRALKNPSEVKEFTPAQWQAFLSQAYQTGLLARFYFLFKTQTLLQFVPPPLSWHFNSAHALSLAHRRDIRIEVEHIERALKMVGIQPVFLKGVAYDLAQDKVAEGRVFSDVDIFIGKAELASAEHALGLHGWNMGKMTAYDRSYYRRWMHELPPMIHRERGMTLDVHHSLLPVTCRYAFDPTELQFDVSNGHCVLSLIDRIIHAFCHLLMESEFEKGLRDLSDLDLLFRQLDTAAQWNQLLTRTEQLGVGRLCFYALRYVHLVLVTPIPDFVLQGSQRWAPSAPVLGLMDWAFPKVLVNALSMTASWRIKLAHFLLYLRGHWLRMPLHLLAPHLARKAWMRISGSAEQETAI
ncbi:nucleotidyltransferase family protein [Bowmanella sp. Y26]|uniref:nucleotidyltransferase family protein n=1 Tax=Bowmanella yangjiangensis TaxID=2811230 RepID=UPI001BDD4890|nr:nucleotidyltransferase family protein [Bowmanella yangjiangensis]MBT1064867.1 nucleotidyltransferase family protein [Bowmanella yangjiangensis]